MGNFHTPGVVKFWWRNELVDTKYETIHHIPLININKQQGFIPPVASTDTVAILHYDDSRQAAQLHDKLKNIQGLKVYAIPNQNSKENFSTIQNNYSSSFGKMTMNGSTSHPLFKYLKKNCLQFYDYDCNSAKKRIQAPIGVFMVQNSMDGAKNIVTYYSSEKLTKYIEQKTK